MPSKSLEEMSKYDEVYDIHLALKKTYLNNDIDEFKRIFNINSYKILMKHELDLKSMAYRTSFMEIHINILDELELFDYINHIIQLLPIKIIADSFELCIYLNSYRHKTEFANQLLNRTDDFGNTLLDLLKDDHVWKKLKILTYD